MEPDSRPPLLTVLIPTRNRAAFLSQAVDAFAAEIERLDVPGQVEVVCADNWSTDDTPVLVSAAAIRYPFVRYQRQEHECPTAEVSLANAVRFATGTFVWCFGDDDLPLDGTLPVLLRTLADHAPDFLLLNPKILADGGTLVGYFSAVDEFVAFRDGLAMFRQFGLVSATTTMSCLCFRRDVFDARIALECAALSPIYSHTFALLCMFHDRAVGFLSTPMLVYRQNSVATESERFSVWSDSHGQPMEWVFTVGLIRLLEYAHRQLPISLKRLSHFEEVELRKDTWAVQHSLLWTFIGRFALSRLRRTARLDGAFGLRADVRVVFSVVWLLLRVGTISSVAAAAYVTALFPIAVTLAALNRVRLGGAAHDRAKATAFDCIVGLGFRYLASVEGRYFSVRRSPASSGVQASEFSFGSPVLDKPVFYE
jgi:glycosyltransferase involved in cell wall biosynthesis